MYSGAGGPLVGLRERIDTGLRGVREPESVQALIIKRAHIQGTIRRASFKVGQRDLRVLDALRETINRRLKLQDGLVVTLLLPIKQPQTSSNNKEEG